MQQEDQWYKIENEASIDSPALVVYPQRITRFSCLTDHLDAAIPISEAACAHQLLIPVYIDLNTGMNRTGIAPGPQALALYGQCLGLPGIRV